jgi:hypothetical protein
MQEEQAEVLVAQDEPVVYHGGEEEESDRENV